MTSVSGEQIKAILLAYDFSEFSKIVDIGGGVGSLLASVLRKEPSLQGILYELPEVIEASRQFLKAQGLDSRCQVKSGDFFSEVPSGADAYLLKYILHDWGDERASLILKNCRQSMKTGGKLLVIEQIIPEGNTPFFAKFADLSMHALHGGKERTESEFRDLFQGAGFRLGRIIPTTYLMSVLEGEPV
jgi:16S rRNA G1207 methylase RsmC